MPKKDREVTIYKKLLRILHTTPMQTWHSILGPEYNFTLFFSLPSYPVRRKTYFYHGHIALALGATVYQLHDPAMLRSSFMVARMPLDTWLFRGGPWFDDDLYETAETNRTVIFYAALKNFPQEKLARAETYINQLEHSYRQGALSFFKYGNNCATLINPIYYREGWLRANPLDFMPAVIFRRLCRAWQRAGLHFAAGGIDRHNPADYRLHRFCWGLLPLYPEKIMQRWLSGMQKKETRRVPSAPGEPEPAAARITKHSNLQEDSV